MSLFQATGAWLAAYASIGVAFFFVTSLGAEVMDSPRDECNIRPGRSFRTAALRRLHLRRFLTARAAPVMLKKALLMPIFASSPSS